VLAVAAVTTGGDGMTAPRTVCFLTGTLNALAGAERMTAVMASALAERGYRVHVISLWDRESCFPLHPTVRHHALFEQRPSFKTRYAATVAGIRRYVREHAIDTLIEVDPMLTLFTVLATLGLGVHRIAWEHCHFHEDLGRPMRRFARRIAARTGAAIVVLTERDRQQWRAALAPRCRVVVIPNALPFPYPALPAERKSKTVLAVGRLTAAKGFDVLLRAWSQVSPRFPQWRLRIVGDGEQRAALESQVASQRIADTVSMVGGTREVAREYSRADVFCLSSRYEGFGLVLIEAMAYGLPIVATACETGPSALLEHGRSAYMVGVDDDVSLANGLAAVMSDPAMADTLAHGGRMVARTFAIEAVADLWSELLAVIVSP
jgi:glycosyltransferase involved in cell wall biosynthesis